MFYLFRMCTNQCDYHSARELRAHGVLENSQIFENVSIQVHFHNGMMLQETLPMI